MTCSIISLSLSLSLSPCWAASAQQRSYPTTMVPWLEGVALTDLQSFIQHPVLLLNTSSSLLNT